MKKLTKQKGFTLIGPKDHDRAEGSWRERLHKHGFTLIKPKAYDRNEVSGREITRKAAFTLIELIVVMAVIGILVLLAAPKFLGYTQKAQETKHIHTAKVIETALEAYLIHGGVFPEDLEVVDETVLTDAMNNKSLYGVNGLIGSPDGETYYELTHDFIQKLDVKLSANNKLFIEAMASSVPTALYASEKGITLVDKAKTLKGYVLQSGELPNEINTSNVHQISAGTHHTLALMNDGRLLSWGRNTNGQLGDGTTDNRLVPSEVINISDIESVHASISSSFAILKDGSVKVWGQNMNGILAVGHIADILSPELSKLTNVQKISIDGLHGLALLDNGKVMSWGNGEYGQLGYVSGKYVHTPTLISELDEVIDIATGGYHSMALLNNGTVKSWGMNSSGQLGLGNQIQKSLPTLIPGLANVEAIKGGEWYSYAIINDGTIKSWGTGSNGQLGLGASITRQLFPRTIEGIGGAKIIATSGMHTFAITESGLIKSWGANSYGQLADETTVNKFSPTEIDRFINVESVAVGGARTFIVLKNGTIEASGHNGFGQFGDGTTENRLTPTIITIE